MPIQFLDEEEDFEPKKRKARIQYLDEPEETAAEEMPPVEPERPPMFGGTPGGFSIPGSLVSSDKYTKGFSDEVTNIAEDTRQSRERGTPGWLAEPVGAVRSMAAVGHNLPVLKELGDFQNKLSSDYGNDPYSSAEKENRVPSLPEIVGEDRIPEWLKTAGKGVLAGAEVAGTALGAGNLLKRGVVPTQDRLAFKKAKAVEEGVEQGVKPRFTSEKKTVSGYKKYKANAGEAADVIDEYKGRIGLLDETGEAITLPRNNAEFAQAIEKTKKAVYDDYDALARQATGAGVSFDPTKIQSKLTELSKSRKTSDFRKYAAKMADEMEVLKGASPAEVQDFIRDMNESLEGYYKGRGTPRVQARIDGSIAQALREELDEMITSATGPGYQELKNKYGALKAMEQDVNHRALQLAKAANKGFFDITDVFTGGDIISGIATQNPALLTRGVTGKAISGYMKWLNDPDRYINKMFKTVADVNEKTRRTLNRQ